MPDSEFIRPTKESPFTTFASFLWCFDIICFFLFWIIIKKKNYIWQASVSSPKRELLDLKSLCRQYKASTRVHIHEGVDITDIFSYGNKSPEGCEEAAASDSLELCHIQLIWVRSSCVAYRGSSHGRGSPPPPLVYESRWADGDEEGWEREGLRWQKVTIKEVKQQKSKRT